MSLINLYVLILFVLKVGSRDPFLNLLIYPALFQFNEMSIHVYNFEFD